MHYGAASAIEVAVLSDTTCFQEFSGSSLVPDYLFFLTAVWRVQISETQRRWQQFEWDTSTNVYLSYLDSLPI